MRKRFLPLFLFALLVLLLSDPERYFLSVKGGAILFAGAVLPSMLPYFFFTKVLTGTGCVGALSGTLGRPVAKAYRVAPIASYPLLMSFLSGYPVGARVLADLHEKGLLSTQDLCHASAFCSTSGSMFVLGSVGAVILNDGTAGAVILVAHYLGALLNGFFYRGKRKDGAAVPLPPPVAPAGDLLSEAMYQSVLSLALVGGFIALAGLLGDMAIDLLSRVGLGGFFAKGSVASGLLYGAFEVTRGAVEFSCSGVGRLWKAALCCGVISFGGLSVLLQTMAFLEKTGIKKGRILLQKTTQGVLSFALCLGLGALVL